MRVRQIPGRAIVLSKIIEQNRRTHIRDVAGDKTRAVDVDASGVVARARRHGRRCVGVHRAAIAEDGIERTRKVWVVEKPPEGPAVKRTKQAHSVVLVILPPAMVTHLGSSARSSSALAAAMNFG